MLKIVPSRQDRVSSRSGWRQVSYCCPPCRRSQTPSMTGWVPLGLPRDQHRSRDQHCWQSPTHCFCASSPSLRQSWAQPPAASLASSPLGSLQGIRMAFPSPCPAGEWRGRRSRANLVLKGAIGLNWQNHAHNWKWQIISMTDINERQSMCVPLSFQSVAPGSWNHFYS